MSEANSQMKTLPSARDVSESLCAILSEGIDVHQCAAAKALHRIGDARATPALTEALLDEDQDVRTDAAVALVGRTEARACRQLLENLIGDPCGEVKLSAIDALVAARYEPVVPWLRQLVVSSQEDEIAWDEDGRLAGGWDDWTDVQLRAIAALGDLGVEAAVADIVAAIANGEQQDVSSVGCTALAKLGAPGVAALAAMLDDAEEPHRRRAGACLAGLDGPDAAAGVVKALNDKASAVRLAVGQVLAARDPGDQRLEMLLLDRVPEVRVAALRLCGSSHPNRLDLLLDDTSPAVCGAVADLLSRPPIFVDAQSMVPRIRDMFESNEASLAGVAAQALAVLEPGDCREKLIDAVCDAELAVEIRLGALKGLSRIGGEPAIQAMVDVLGGDDRQVRVQAMSSLLKIAAGDESWPNLAGTALLDALTGELVPEPEPESEPESESDEAKLAVLPGEPDAVSLEDLVEADTQNPDGEAENTIPDTFPMSTLASILADETQAGEPQSGSAPDGLDDSINAADLEFLAMAQSSVKLGKKRVSLTPQVAPHADVPVVAARLLGDLPRQGVSDALALLLGSPIEGLAYAAADSLASLANNGDRFSAETHKRLIGVLNDSDRLKRLCAIRALAASGCDLAVMPFINLLTDADSFVRAEAIRGLVRLDAVAGGVRELLDDPDPSVRLAAAGAVGHLGGDDAVATLGRFAMAFEGYHGRQAAGLIREIDRGEGNAFFMDVLADAGQKRIWQVAIEALAELNATTADASMALNS